MAGGWLLRHAAALLIHSQRILDLFGHPEPGPPACRIPQNGICRPSSQLMNFPEVFMDTLPTSCNTRLAPTEASTAPSMSQMCENLEVMSVRLKPGWSITMGTPMAFSSSDMSTPPMLHAALDMWWPPC